LSKRSRLAVSSSPRRRCRLHTESSLTVLQAPIWLPVRIDSSNQHPRCGISPPGSEQCEEPSHFSRSLYNLFTKELQAVHKRSGLTWILRSVLLQCSPPERSYRRSGRIAGAVVSPERSYRRSGRIAGAVVPPERLSPRRLQGRSWANINQSPAAAMQRIDFEARSLSAKLWKR